MIARLLLLVEWVRFVFRQERDVQLGQLVDRLMYPRKGKARPKLARRAIALMVSAEFRQRHQETLIRAGY